jgi:hypothetical protein
MDRKITEIVVRHALVRRAEQILNAAGLFGLGDYSEADYIARTRAIFREEKELLTTEEILEIGRESEPRKETNEVALS